MDGKRITAFIIDDVIASMIFLIPFCLQVVYPVITGNQPSDILLRTLLSTFISIIYLILRDLPKKGSIGKRILKLKIIDSETKELASVKQRFLRNIPWLLGMIEILVYIISNKRIGVRIAKTDVIEE